MTGGAGFIGSHVVEALLERPVRKVVVLDDMVRGSQENLAAVRDDDRLQIIEGSIADVDLLRETCADMDGIFHLAALWLKECIEEPRRALDVNVVGTYNVIEAAAEAQVGKVIFSSSASVYGDAVRLPMTEEHPFHNRTMYGATKIAGEQFLRASHDTQGLDYIGLRYMNVYGPRMDDKGAYMSVIMNFLKQITAGEPPTIHGDGSQSYDFVHVRDVARANVLAMESDATDLFLNVGTGHATTIADLCTMLAGAADTDIHPTYVDDGPIFVQHRLGATERAKEEIGFEAKIPLETGLDYLVRWYQAENVPDGLK